MPDKALMRRNAELQSALTKLRAEAALAQETLQAAQLCTLSTSGLLARMRRALEDIQRRTAPGSVLATADLDGPAYEDVAEIHDIALAALTEAEQVGEQLRSEA